MTKLSANRAAKEAGVAKKTLLEAMSSGRLTAEKNDKGHWEIDPAELFRVYPKTSLSEPEKPQPTHQENNLKTSQNSALEIEVKMLREQIERMDTERVIGFPACTAQPFYMKILFCKYPRGFGGRQPPTDFQF